MLIYVRSVFEAGEVCMHIFITHNFYFILFFILGPNSRVSKLLKPIKDLRLET